MSAMSAGSIDPNRDVNPCDIVISRRVNKLLDFSDKLCRLSGHLLNHMIQATMNICLSVSPDDYYTIILKCYLIFFQYYISVHLTLEL